MIDEHAKAYRQAAETRLTPRGRSGNDHNYACPFCERDGSSGELHVHWTKRGRGAAICHQCHYHAGSVQWLVRDLFGGHLPLSVKWLPTPSDVLKAVKNMLTASAGKAGEDGAPLPESFRRLRRVERNPVARLILNYLRGRGVSQEDIERYGLGWVDDAESPAFGYAIFPFNVGGRCVYWQGRRVAGTGPKSYNPPSTYKESLLYGYDEAVGCDTVFVCEGPMDALAWGPGGLALTGKYILRGKVRAIAGLSPKRIIVCGDPDAVQEWRSIYSTLASGTSARVAWMGLVGDDDPAKVGRRRLHAIAKTLSFRRNDVLGVVERLLA